MNPLLSMLMAFDPQLLARDVHKDRIARLDAGAQTGMTMTDLLDLIHLHEEERERLMTTAIHYAQAAKDAKEKARSASGAARKIFNARAAKISKSARKHIEKTEAAMRQAHQERDAAEAREAATLTKHTEWAGQVAKDASLISIMNTHIENPAEGCNCAVCKMHSMMKDLKAKYRMQKEILKGFQGPKAKK